MNINTKKNAYLSREGKIIYLKENNTSISDIDVIIHYTEQVLAVLSSNTITETNHLNGLTPLYFVSEKALSEF